MNSTNSNSDVWIQSQISPDLRLARLLAFMGRHARRMPYRSPAAEIARANDRAQTRALIESVLGSVRRGSPDPGTSVRSAFGMYLLATFLFTLVFIAL